MAADPVIPLITWDEFTGGAFKDLARNYTDTGEQDDLLAEATRMCESHAGDRRLAPFADLVETHRLDGIDPDEYTDSANLPLDLQGTLGRNYAQALSASTLVRHCWLRQYATRYPEMWTYDPGLTVEVVRSYGGSQIFTVDQLDGPELDSGHVWFHLGAFVPIGSLARVTYGGGYSVATPADLKRAAKYMVAALIVDELQPNSSARDPEVLRNKAAAICVRYAGDGDRDAHK